MQDRFKFRFFSVNKQEMYDVKNICFWGEPIVTINYKPVLKEPIYEGYLMQCTGLKDKNGKLIFEGDIVRLFNTRDSFEEIRQVVYKDCAFQFNLPNSTQIDRPLYCFAINYLNHYKHIELEVIGNYKQALDEIEKYLKTQLDGFGNAVYFVDKPAIKKISDIINKAKDGE